MTQDSKTTKDFQQAAKKKEDVAGHLFHVLRNPESSMEKIRGLIDKLPEDASEMRLVDCLNMAIAENRLEAAEILLQKDVPTEAVRPDGQPPIIHAADAKNHKAIELLVAAGADVDAPHKKNGQTALMRSIVDGEVEIVKFLLKSHANTAVNNKQGDTALALAVKAGNPDMVDALLAAPGIDIQSINKDGLTPLMLAARAGNVDIVDQLLDAGAAMEQKTNKGETALMQAAILGQTKTLKQLAARGGDPETRDGNQLSVLDRAVRSKRADVVDILIDLEVKVDRPDHDGRTPLMGAAQNGDRKILRKLLAAGASPAAADKNGRTALIHAIAVGVNKGVVLDRTETVKILLDAGAKINTRDDSQQTALDYAQKTGEEGFIAFLQARAEEQRAAQLAEDVQNATILSRPIQPVRTPSFKPKNS